MSFYSYVLKSCNSGILYKGSTEDLSKRLATHNQGKVKFTSKHIPWKLVLFEEFETRSKALQREKWYKSGVGREWIKIQIENLSE